MPLTINDVLTTFQPGAYLPAPLAGTVKQAFETRTGQYGPFQGFILQDATGEISCTLSGNEDGTDFAPVKKGDQVEITPTMNGKQQLTGAKIATYNNKNQIKVAGLRHLKNLSAPAATAYTGQAAPGQYQPQAPAPQAAMQAPMSHTTAPQPVRTPPASSVSGKMGESQARQAWWRTFQDILGRFGYLGSWPGLAAEVPAHILDVAARTATTVLMGLERGSLVLEEGLEDEVLHPTGGTFYPNDPSWMREEK